MVRRGPGTVAIFVEDEPSPVGGRSRAHIHHRRVAEAASEVQVDAARRPRRVARQLDERQGRTLEAAFEGREVRERDDQRRDGDSGWLRDQDEPEQADDESHSKHRRDRANGSFDLHMQALQVRGHPETRKAKRPESHEEAKRVIPRVDRRQIKHGEADPQRGIAVAPRLQVEAGDRDQEDGEVRLRQHAAKQRERRIGDHVKQGAEDQRREHGLAPETALAVAPAIAHDVADPGPDDTKRGDHVVLAVKHNRECGDNETGEHQGAPFDRILDG